MDFLNRVDGEIRLTFLVLLAAVVATIACLDVRALLPASAGVARISMEVSDGEILELYVNDLSREPLRAVLQKGGRRDYVVSGLHEDLRLIRLDPGEAQGASIAIYGIAIESGGVVVANFTPEDLASWAGGNIRDAKVEGGAFRFTAVNSDPMLVGSVFVHLATNLPPGVFEFVSALGTPRAVVGVVAFGFIALLGVGLVSQGLRAHAALAGITVAVTVFIFPSLSATLSSWGTASMAVGQAIYLGQSLGGAGKALVVLSLFMAAASFFLARRQGTAIQADDAKHAGCWERWGLWLGVAAIVIYDFPELRGWANHYLSVQYEPNWDGNNVLVWGAMAHDGRLPLRDYWFPYSGFFAFDLPLPWGPVATSLVRGATHIGLFLSLRAVIGRVGPAAIIIILAIVGEQEMVYWGAYRYLLSITVALSYLAAGRREGRPWLFWIMFGEALFVEPVQLAYASPAVAAILALDLLRDGWPGRAAIWARLAAHFLVPAGMVALLLSVWAISGQLHGTIDFYAGLSDQAAASAQAYDAQASVSSLLGVRFFIAAGVLACVVIGAWESARRRPVGPALLVIGLVGMMMAQKHFVRPIDWQLFLIPSLGFALYVAMSRGAPIIRAVVVGAILGGHVALLLVSSGGAAQWRHFKAGFDRLPSFVRILTEERDLLRRANEARYQPDHFSHFTWEMAAAAALRAEGMGGEAHPVYVLTDNAILYLLLDQPTPYHVNIYNASPIYEQRKNVQWLRDRTPERVVLDTRQTAFDAVPNEVRVPLIYDAVIGDYVPHGSVGPLDILRRRRADEPVAMEYWRGRLGSRFNAGALGAVGAAERTPPCAASEPCREVMLVEAPAGRVVVPVEIDGKVYEISFEARGVMRHHALALDRVWFWDVAKRVGRQPRIVVEHLPEGVTAEVVSRDTSDTLY